MIILVELDGFLKNLFFKIVMSGRRASSVGVVPG